MDVPRGNVYVRALLYDAPLDTGHRSPSPSLTPLTPPTHTQPVPSLHHFPFAYFSPTPQMKTNVHICSLHLRCVYAIILFFFRLVCISSVCDGDEVSAMATPVRYRMG